ncbi:hypothetical protein EYF80_009524 [Liparis tanakae]|uniref:Uncharacterized protein n=1 Tax=Liparis tanakae TaxID=230148 RepID=A0A4Z2IQF9_9TELE|nr:hypothetical protein EYF80_009524 [Liparis tanakae]
MSKRTVGLIPEDRLSDLMGQGVQSQGTGGLIPEDRLSYLRGQGVQSQRTGGLIPEDRLSDLRGQGVQSQRTECLIPEERVPSASPTRYDSPALAFSCWQNFGPSVSRSRIELSVRRGNLKSLSDRQAVNAGVTVPRRRCALSRGSEAKGVSAAASKEKRLPVACLHPQQRPFVSEPQKAAQCWVIDRATRPRLLRHSKPHLLGGCFRETDPYLESQWKGAVSGALVDCHRIHAERTAAG